MEIKCFTDGSCLDGGKFKKVCIGAWAYKVIINENDIYINSGTQVDVTSSLMEIEAVKQTLIHLNKLKDKFDNANIIIYSDCLTVIQNLNRIINKEKIKAKAKMKLIYNEIIGIIDSIGANVVFQWIKGHNSKSKKAESIHNNDVDKLARQNARILAKELKPCVSKKKVSKKLIEQNTIPIIKTKVPNDAEQYVFFYKYNSSKSYEIHYTQRK